jgi:hypothetical protein
MTNRRTSLIAIAALSLTVGLSAPAFAGSATHPQKDETPSYIAIVNALVDSGINPIDEPLNANDSTDVGKLAVFCIAGSSTKGHVLQFADGHGGQRLIKFTGDCAA